MCGVKVHVHRLVVVDDDNVVQGIVSLSDVLHYLVLAPLGQFFKLLILLSPLVLVFTVLFLFLLLLLLLFLPSVSRIPRNLG